MARTDLPVVTSTDTGVDLSTAAVAAVAGGHKFADNGRRLLYVTNSDTVAHTVEVVVAQTVEGLAVGPQVINVPAGAHRVAGVLTGAYRQPDGSVHVNVPVLTGVKLAVLETR